jgi:hypothetical protein
LGVSGYYIRNMRTGDALLLIGGGVGLWFLAKYNAARRILFFPGSIQSMAFVNGSPLAYIDVLVQNTSNADLTVHSLAGTVYANGYLVGNISSFQPTSIRRNSESRFPVTIRFNLIGVVNDIIRAFQTGSFKQDFVLEGSANVEGFNVPINLKFTAG